ncbi:MAG: PQQ-binding-like beta-propeller repeat protein [Pirellulales bacterium]|nr:PQQ-binding-like beta-propeller repeat protein [Pirellulales bacterium]
MTSHRPFVTILLVTIFVQLLIVSLPVRAENWPGWRGPRGDGTSLEKGIPTQWDGPTGKNIAWKTPIPGAGHASPIVWGDRVFVVSAMKDTGDRMLFCIDRRGGKILWRRCVLQAPMEKKHRLNSHASGTPVTDGHLVYVAFLDTEMTTGKKPSKSGKMYVAAYDFDGNRKWQARPGVFSSIHGFCTSPLIYENLLILNGDHDGDGYLVALDRATGKTVWKTPRPNNTRSYCPPLVREIDGRVQMVLSGSLCVASYDPRDGRELWIMDGPTEQFVASPVYNGKYIFITAGFPTWHILAIKPDGKGKIGDEKIVWRTEKGCAYVPSPIVADGKPGKECPDGKGRYFLIASDQGIGSCFEAATGKRYWMERLGKHYSASTVSADGLVHFLSDQGITKIIRPGEKFDLVAENHLGEDCYASPAISQGRIFIRGERNLYCIGK